MEAKELKIGNFIDRNGLLIKVSRNTIFDLDELPHILGKIYQPIKLTEEWMLKLGGKRDEFNDVFIHINETYDIRLYLTDGFIQICKGHSCPLFNFEHIKYVHLLQNLFFDHTAKYLELKQ